MGFNKLDTTQLISKPNDDQQPEPQIGIITALEEEYAAVKSLLINSRDKTIPGKGAGRRYTLGEIPAANGGRHHIALALADMGNNSAAIRATQLLFHYNSVEHIIMVGIAGGVPNPQKPSEHVRLGDVVVSNYGGVIQYDLDKETISETMIRSYPRPPSAFLLEALRLFNATKFSGKRPWIKFIDMSLQRLKGVSRPGEDTDILLDSISETSVIQHPDDPERKHGEPRIFEGPIASANKLLKNPIKRDMLRDCFGVKAIEMEASGIADATWKLETGYLVVRGICDYCAGNKDNSWHGYAAVVAAAYTRALLESIPVDYSPPNSGSQGSVQPHLIHIIPDVSYYINRGEDEKFFSKPLETHKIEGINLLGREIPILYIGGLPGSGLSTLAGHLANQYGKPIWINNAEFNDVASIISQIGLILKEFYGQGALDKYLRENDAINIPNTTIVPAIHAVAEYLSKDDFILCMDNFHEVEANSPVVSFLKKLQNICENNSSAKFKTIIIISHNTPLFVGAFYRELKGFDTLDKTRTFLGIYDIRLSDSDLEILHRKTEGYPGILKCFVFLLKLEDSIDFGSVINNLENLDQVKLYVLEKIATRLTEDEKETLGILSLLKDVFLYEDAAQILHMITGQVKNIVIKDLQHKHIVSPPRNHILVELLSIHGLIKSYFLSDQLTISVKKTYHKKIGNYYLGKTNYSLAIYHFLQAEEFKTAAEMLIKGECKNKILKQENIGLYNEFLYMIEEKHVDRATWRYINIRRGDVLEILSNYKAARSQYEKTLALCSDKDLLHKIRIYRRLNWVHQRLCLWEDAIKAYENGIKILRIILEKSPRETDALIEKGRLQSQLSMVYFKQFRFPEAIGLAEEGINILTPLIEKAPRTKQYLAQAYLFVGLIYFDKGVLEQALESFTKAGSYFEDIQDLYGACEAKLHTARVFGETNHGKDKANQLFDDVICENQHLGSRKIAADIYRGKGKIELRAGNFTLAKEHLNKALEINSQIDDIFSQAWSHNTLGNMYRTEGLLDDATKEWKKALEIFEMANSPRDKIGVSGNLAGIYKLQGEFSAARKAWQEGLRFAKDVEDYDWAFAFMANIAELDIIVDPKGRGVKEQLKECEKITKKDQHIAYLHYIKGLYYLENGQYSAALENINSCCNQDNRSFYQPYFDALLTRVEILLLQNSRKEARQFYNEIEEYTQSLEETNDITAKLARTRGLILIGDDNNEANKVLIESSELFKDMGGPMEYAETQFKAGKLMAKYNLSGSKDYLLNARKFFQAAGAKSRVHIIDSLIK
jgi:nucleoside phosphorylase/tetratricopeptide (TPR) repeat protein